MACLNMREKCQKTKNVWKEGRPTFSDVLQRFWENFEHPEGGKEAGEQFLALRQEKNTAVDYAVTFHTLVA